MCLVRLKQVFQVHESSGLHVESGRCYMVLRKYVQARDHFEKATKLVYIMYMYAKDAFVMYIVHACPYCFQLWISFVNFFVVVFLSLLSYFFVSRLVKFIL